MAEKECTIYIVDVAQSMGKKRQGRDISDLDWAMQYVWDKIAGTIATGRKTLYSSLLALRSDDTAHDGPQEEEYENLSIVKPPAQILLEDVRRLQEIIKPSRTNDGDCISAIIVAIQMITTFCKTQKYRKTIVLVTNADGKAEADGLEDIARKLKDENINLVILGVDMDDLEYGFKEEDKDEAKELNERTLKALADLADGKIGTLKEATDELKIPRLRLPRSAPTFKGKLRLGDSESYDSAMEIDVERYGKVMVQHPQPARKITIKNEDAMDSASSQTQGVNGEKNDDSTLVYQTTLYEIKDEKAPGGKRDVERDDLSKGYTYGRSVVHVDPADEDQIKFETTSGLDIMGFVPRGNVAHYTEMSKTCTIIAQKTNDLAAMALSSFIHTLYELDTCAIARLVTKQDKPPVVLALAPLIEPDFECLIDVELPFAEDYRQHRFPPLDRIPTISGKVLTEHRLLPNEDLQEAMSAYVKGMDLSEADTDEDGKKTDYLKLEDSFSPKLHRLNQAIQFRAIHPNEPIPPVNEILLKYSHPPEHVMERTQEDLERVQELADVKKVPPKSMSRRNFRGKKAQEAPRSGLDTSALLSERSAANKHRISPDNAIPEFKQILADAEDVDTIKQCVSQLSEIIQTWIRNSMGDSDYGRAIEGMKVMRQECTELEEPGLFNGFLRDLKMKLFMEELGGDRREMWWQVRSNRLGLIEKNVAAQSEVGEEEARQFMIPSRTRT